MTRVRYWLARRQAKAAELPFIPSWIKTSWLDPSFDRLTREGYKANAAVYGCISALTFAFPEAPLVVSQLAGDPLPRHPLQLLLQRPNPLLSEAELALIVATYLSIGGNCYLHKIRSGAGLPVELWPYHAGQMRPVPSPTAWVDAYEYTDGSGVWHRVPAADIVHLRWPSVDPEQPWLALPPLRAVAREVDTDTEATRYLYALLVNDAMPRAAITLPPGVTLTDAQFARLQQQWQSRHGGDNRGRAAFLEGGATVERLALSMEELAFDALRRVPETRIAMAFRVPAIIAGLNAGLEKATYANFAEARRMFVENTLVPLWRLIADTIEQDLGAEFGGNLLVRHDLGRVGALQENEDAKYTRVLGAWESGLITRNEGRQALGLPRVEDLRLGPGAPALPPGDTFTGQPTAAPQIVDVTPTTTTTTTSGQRRLKAAGTAPDAIERRIQRTVQRYLRQQYAAAAAAVEAHG
jgi:HK97 family phage portal protein